MSLENKPCVVYFSVHFPMIPITWTPNPASQNDDHQPLSIYPILHDFISPIMVLMKYHCHKRLTSKQNNFFKALSCGFRTHQPPSCNNCQKLARSYKI